MGNFTFYSFHVFKCAFLSKRTKRAIGLLAFCLPILTYGQTPCAPISTLDCDDIAVVLPYSLDFSASTPNTLADAAVNGTGFTMSLDHSEARRSSDLPISNPLANGYEPSLLSLGGGSLQLLSQGGIAYLDPPASNNNNNQVNTLGVGITDMASSFIVKSTLLNIVTGGGGAQAGIWYGYDEDNFVKLNVNNNNNIELRVESAGASTAANQIQLALGASGQDVVLELVLDPINLTVTAYHTIGGSARTLLGTLPVPANYFIGSSIDGTDTAFAGIFNTHRYGAQFTASFDDFSVQPVLNIANDIVDFTVAGQIGSSVIDATAHTVSAELPSGSDLTDVSPAVTVSTGAVVSPLSGVSQDFSNPVVYTVTAEDGITMQDWVVSITEATTLSTSNDIVDFTVAGQIGSSVIDATAHTVSAELPSGSDLTDVSPTVVVSDGATANPASGASQDFSNPVVYTVTAEDGTPQQWTVTLTIESTSICAPISTLDCDDIAVVLPYSLDFSASTPNTLADAAVNGTGFTMSLDHSEARRSGDLPISNPLANGYEPSLLSLNGGALQILTQRGIAYLDPPASNNNNNQVNTLGVGITDMASSFIVKSTLLNIVTGGGGAQAGIWYGYDEDNFVKLNVNNNNNIELRVESAGASTAANQIQLALGASGQDVVLELVLDPINLTVTAYHTIGGSARTLLGTLPVPANYFIGRSIDGTNMNFGGVYATHRGGTQFTASFDDFSVQPVLNIANDIVDFTVAGQIGSSVIDATAHTVSAELPSGSDLTDVSPAVTVSSGAAVSPLSGVSQDFSNPVIYTVTAEDGITMQDWVVTITDEAVLSTSNDILDFTIAGQIGSSVINATAHTVSVEFAEGTDLTNLSPTVTISDGATVNPASGASQDFSNPVVYTVTAEDGTPQQWTVTTDIIIGNDSVDLVLINAITDTEIGPLVDGQILDADVLPTLDLNIRAIITSPEVNSLTFSLSGPIGKFTFENSEPLTVFNTVGNDYLPQRFAVGDYTLTVNAYSGMNYNESLVESIDFNFSVIKSSNTCWTNLASSSFARTESQSAKVGDNLYVFSGFTSTFAFGPETEIYHVPTDTWSLGTPIPFPGNHMGLVVVGTDVWLLGGFLGANWPGLATTKVQIYHTLTDTWSAGPDLPGARAAGAAVLNDNKIHFFGGLLADRTTDVGDHFVLDLAAQGNGWTTAADMPIPRNHLSGANVNGLLYAIGGQIGHDTAPQDQTLVHAYNPVTDTWSSVADLPYPRSHFEPGTDVYDGKILIAGGKQWPGPFYDTVTVYDPVLDEWSELCKLPEQLFAPAAKVFGNTLIVTNGGLSGTDFPTRGTRSMILDMGGTMTYDLIVNNGTGDGSYEAGEVVGIFADAAAPGEEFSEWTGDVGGITDVNSPSTTIILGASNTTITATYSPISGGNDLPWLEDFDDLANGTIVDNGDTAWSSTVTNGQFHVTNGVFRTHDGLNRPSGTGAFGVWSSEVINLNGSVVSITIDIDDMDDNKEPSDYIKVSYVIDGGTPIDFGQLQGNIDPQTFNVSNISGNTLQILVESQVSYFTESYVFDNVNISQQGGTTARSFGDAKTLNDLSLVPNPSSIETNLVFDQPIQVATIQVFDVTGKLVQTINGGMIDRLGRPLELLEYPDGVYFVKITSSSGEQFQKRLLIKK